MVKLCGVPCAVLRRRQSDVGKNSESTEEYDGTEECSTARLALLFQRLADNDGDDEESLLSLGGRRSEPSGYRYRGLLRLAMSMGKPRTLTRFQPGFSMTRRRLR